MNMLAHFAQTSDYYDSYSSSTGDDMSIAATIAVILGTFLIFALIYAVSAYLLSRIFKKAGIPEWKAWVPFYGQWKLLELGGQQGFWVILTFIPIVQYVAIVFMFIAMYNVGVKLGKSGVFVLWAIFLPIVWYIWLAVDDSKWNDSLGAPSKASEHQIPPTNYAPGSQAPNA